MTVGFGVAQFTGLLCRLVGGSTACAVALLSAGNAYAVSDRVKSACRNDYFQHCSQYAVGSDELRQCMRNVGEDLSTPCLVALVQEGEITKEDVTRHNAAKADAKPKLDKSAKSEEVARGDAVDPKDVNAKTKNEKTTAKKNSRPKKTAIGKKAKEPAAKNGTAKTAKTPKRHKTSAKAKTAKTVVKKKGKIAKVANKPAANAVNSGGSTAKKKTAAAKAGKKVKGQPSGKKTAKKKTPAAAASPSKVAKKKKTPEQSQKGS